jgi:trehalose-6-phosphate synthase
MVWSINDRYGTDDWRPIHLVKDTVPPERLALLYRAADLCIVSSLQDGMNLVAKEYVASQGEEGRGVLILSRFAGAVEELTGCLAVNPYDREDFAARIDEALIMPQDERLARMQLLRSSLRTIYDWMAETFEVWAAAAEGGVPVLADADRWSRTG